MLDPITYPKIWLIPFAGIFVLNILLLHTQSVFGQNAGELSHISGNVETLPDTSSITIYSPQKYDSVRVDTLISHLQKILHDQNIPGMGIAVFDSSGVYWAGGLGYAIRKERKPVTINTLFRAGSITKSFVAVGLLQLVEQGKFSLEDHVHALVPEVPIKNQWRKTDPITVAQVLEHTAGLDNAHPRFMVMHDSSNVHNSLLKQLERQRASLKIRWKPGSRMAYSNVDYLLAGYLLQKISGQSYEDYLQQHVMEPLGIQAAVIRQGTVPAELAQGYTNNGRDPIKVYWVPQPPAGALILNATGLAHLGVMLLDHGEWNGSHIIDSTDVIRMQTPETSEAAHHGLTQGYGLADFVRNRNGYLEFGHDGRVPGFSAEYGYLPALGKGYVLMFNSGSPEKGTNEAIKTIVNYLSLNASAPKPQKNRPASAKLLADISGYYRVDNPRNAFEAPFDLFQIAHFFPAGSGRLAIKPFLGQSQANGWLGSDRWINIDTTSSASTKVIFQNTDDKMVFDNGFMQGERVGAFVAYGPILILLLSTLFMISTLLFLPVWVIRLLMGRLRGHGYWSVRIPPLVATITFILLVYSFMQINAYNANSINVLTVMFFVSTWLFALASVYGLVQAGRSFRWPVNRWMRLYALLASIACTGVTILLFHYGWIGLRFWSY